MKRKSSSVSPFGLLVISTLELQDSEQEIIIPQENVWSDSIALPQRLQPPPHSPVSAGKHHSYASCVVSTSCLHDVPGRCCSTCGLEFHLSGGLQDGWQSQIPFSTPWNNQPSSLRQEWVLFTSWLLFTMDLILS